MLLVGDAAGYVDALTGEGMAAGFAQAATLVRAVSAGHPERYDAAARRATRRSRGLTTGLLAATVCPRYADVSYRQRLDRRDCSTPRSSLLA